MADNEESGDERAPDAREQTEPGDERDRSFRRLGDSLISSIWGDSSAAFKRGQGLVTGVAQGTKEELVRMISHEVRGFLDKMDAADLMQEIVSGLVIEMKTEIRFRRDDSGRIEPEVRTSDTKVGHEDARPSRKEARAAKKEEAAKPGKAAAQDKAEANGDGEPA
ncbi:hypothetical protein ENSA5_38330 [Enhygromyxa salina]|uniref:Uncharacterized protein n=1 Tax=Enhygromyxa salina TaxID=215803 RepID=A0A2S9XRJ3_9BACT|nr:hypothetical protein [Enhygromyxa salina]PRP95482.1 hypothetical protein ENSA5_38330 [Enhygromyxa salina]